MPPRDTIERHTPQPGERAPEFTLPDSAGGPRRLSELLAGHALVLVFYRGYW
jgi:peroxiredoxin